MKKPRVYVAVAYYGQQESDWWLPLATFAGTMHLLDIDFVGMGAAGSMMADGNRNNLVEEFLKTDADWLFWLDTDNAGTTAALKRLLDTGRTLVSGIYYSKNEPYHAIAYYREANNMYRTVDEADYTRGEIIPIDAAGCGFLLTHRSVYEDIRRAFLLFQDELGHYRLIHKDDIQGEVSPTTRHEYDGKVVKGQLRERLRPVFVEPKSFPWFQIFGGRTEDMFFFERAARVGHKPWLDTSVEAGHIRNTVVTGETRRRARYKLVEKIIEEPHIPEPLQVSMLSLVEESSGD